MANPFKKYLPEDLPPKEEIEENVLGSIHLKAHLAGVLEFFLAIMGSTIRESVLSAAEQGSVNKVNKKPTENPEEPDYFF